MRPIRVKKLQETHRIDFVAVCVLDLISDYKSPTPTYEIVDECLKDGVASPGPVNRCIRLLKQLGYVRDCTTQDKDKRKRYIQITDSGLRFLTTWES